MNFISLENITSCIAMSDYYMPVIDIDSTQTKKLIQSINKQHQDNQLLTDINILNQGIESIDILNYNYKQHDEQLQFSELSRGEKVFLVSLASKYTDTPIYLQYDILQLTKTSLRKYYSLFKDCSNINIIYDVEDTLNYLEVVMQGELL